MVQENAPWFIYILQCHDGTFYTGSSPNVDKRVHIHNLGTGAKYTRSRLPVKLVYDEECQDRSAALRRECVIKKLSRVQKMELIARSTD